MLNDIFGSILTSDAAGNFTVSSFLLCTAASLAVGALIAFVASFKSRTSKGFAITLALMPAMVQMVILLVNGNLGTGVAVMGAFSLVRFRSVPGNAREIGCIFLAMAVGLANGMGYVGVGAVFTFIVGGALLLYTLSPFGEPNRAEKELKITIPEGLDYTGVFDDLFEKYTSKWNLEQVRTTNMGSLYKLDYRIMLKDSTKEKEFLDEIRCRNGNLDIVCGRVAYGKDEL